MFLAFRKPSSSFVLFSLGRSLYIEGVDSSSADDFFNFVLRFVSGSERVHIAEDGGGVVYGREVSFAAFLVQDLFISGFSLLLCFKNFLSLLRIN